jgi:hypothetical protein
VVITVVVAEAVEVTYKAKQEQVELVAGVLAELHLRLNYQELLILVAVVVAVEITQMAL